MKIRGSIIAEMGDKYILSISDGAVFVSLNKSDVKVVSDGVEIVSEKLKGNPLVPILVEISEGRYILPSITGNTVEQLLPVVKIDDRRVLGLVVQYDMSSGDFVGVRDAGMYYVLAPEGDENLAMYPAVKIKDGLDLSTADRQILLESIPPEVIPHLISYNEVLGAEATMILLRKDPYSLLDIEKDEVAKVLKVARKYWSLATPESNPLTMEALLAELRSIAPNAVPELEYIRGRILEETAEEEVKEVQSGLKKRSGGWFSSIIKKFGLNRILVKDEIVDWGGSRQYGAESRNRANASSSRESVEN